MKLNRYNYEEYFILYLDNELASEDRREVEAFAEQNPDLKAELDMLMQSKLAPDTDISFADKGSLLRFDNSSISLANYEEWLTAYIDGELTAGEREDVEEFIAANPVAQKELNLLQQAKLQPEAVVFPYKESLYRTEERAARVISIRWRRIAAAAVLLLAISTTTIIVVNNKKGSKNSEVASNGKEKLNNSTAIEPKKASVPVTTQVTNPKEKSGPVQEPKNEVAVKSRKNKPEEKKEAIDPEKNDQPLIAVTTSKENDRGGNNLAEPIENPNVIRKVDVSSGTGTIVPGGSLTHLEQKSDIPGVTSSPVRPYNKENGAVKQDNPDATFASEKSGGGLRGFLRKVTRTIEKRTNIKATDDDDRLLIAGLAIKMN